MTCLRTNEESFATRRRDGCPVGVRTKVFVGDDSVVVVVVVVECCDDDGLMMRRRRYVVRSRIIRCYLGVKGLCVCKTCVCNG